MGRDDKITEIVVMQGIAIAYLDGVFAGANHMASRGVPLDVAKRVLLNPAKRRDGDWR